MKLAWQKLIFFFFLASGISSLIFQILWVRMFGLIFGNTVFASSIVLAAFMAGLALGGWLAGKIPVHSSHSDGLKLYALLELGIGSCGIILPFALMAATGTYLWLSQTVQGSLFTLTLIRFIISFILLMIPCTLMGATLPVLTKTLVFNFHDSGVQIGILYGLNTLGAVIGCFTSGFYLIGHVGLMDTSIVAASINLAIAGMAYWLIRTPHSERLNAHNERMIEETAVASIENIAKLQRSFRQELKQKPQSNMLGCLLLMAYGMAGFAALALEVAWTRALVWVTGMDSYAFATMLAVILTGIGAGSLWATTVLKRIKNPLSLLAWIQLLLGVMVIFSIFSIQHSYLINQSIETAVNHHQILLLLFKTLGAYTITHLLISAAIFFLPAVLMGVAFPLFARVYILVNGDVGRGIGNIYAINTFGGICGSLVMGFLMIPMMGLLPSIAVMAVIYFGTALAINVVAEPKGYHWWRSTIIVITSLILLLTCDLNFTHFLKTTLGAGEFRQDEKLLYFKEHATGGVMVKKSQYFGREMLIDGVQVASTGDHDLHSHLYPAHLMALLKKDPSDVLVVAFGCGGTCGSILLYPEVKHLDVVEICDGVVAPAKKYFAEMNNGVFQNPKLHLIIQDGKNYVRMTKKHYDIIYSGPIHPQSNQGSAALYTKEYFVDCRNHLKQDGFQCLWLPLHMASPQDFKIIVKTFLEVYPYVTLWQLPQTDMSVSHPHLIGSMEPLYPDYQLITAKLQNPAIHHDLERLNDTAFKEPYEFLSQLTMNEEDLVRWVSDVDQINTDDLPVVEFYQRPLNLFTAQKITKAYLLADIYHYMENPYPYIKNIPEDKKAGLKRELDRLFEGNRNLIQGHYFSTIKNYVKVDVSPYIVHYYQKAYELIPESVYLKKFINANNQLNSFSKPNNDNSLK